MFFPFWGVTKNGKSEAKLTQPGERQMRSFQMMLYKWVSMHPWPGSSNCIHAHIHTYMKYAVIHKMLQILGATNLICCLSRRRQLQTKTLTELFVFTLSLYPSVSHIVIVNCSRLCYIIEICHCVSSKRNAGSLSILLCLFIHWAKVPMIPQWNLRLQIPFSSAARTYAMCV